MCEPAGEFVFLSVSQEHDVETPYGMLHVVIRGAPKGNKPAIITYHDVGLNREYLLQKNKPPSNLNRDVDRCFCFGTFLRR